MLAVRERPPLRLDMEVDVPSGRIFRWGHDDTRPENAPNSLAFSTTIPGGFEQASNVLARDPRLDYPDLAELSDVTIRGVGGQVAWHGRLDSTPRSSGSQQSVSPALVGWQSHLDANEQVQAIYVSQDASQWQGPSLDEQIYLGRILGASQVDFSWTSQNGGLVCSLPNQALGVSTLAELWFTSPAGITIGKVMYLGVDTSMPSGWEAPQLIGSADGTTTVATTDAMTLDGALHSLTPGTPHRYVAVRVNSNGNASTPASGAQRVIQAIGLYGEGIPTHTIDSTTPDGVLASDVVAHALSTWAPLLNVTADSIQPSSFVIPHLTFTGLPNKVSDVITAATAYELLDWAIWENRTFYMNARGVRGNEWQARVKASGLSETGPQTSRIWNSVVVQYADVDGTQRTAGPPGSGCDTTDSSLVDPDPLNPANEAGEIRRAVTQMGTGTPAVAVQIGSRFLQEQKLLDTSGQASIVGHVQDSSGNWAPAWRIRAGDKVRFVDAHDTSPRRVVKTSYDDGSKANSISLDSPPDGMTELLARMSISLIDAGLS